MPSDFASTRKHNDVRCELLRADGAIVAVSGTLLVLFARPSADLLGLGKAGGVRTLGAILLVYGAALCLHATRRPVRNGTLRAVAGLNAAWSAASLALVALDPAGLTATGRGIVAAQAVAVAGLALAQWQSARR